MNTVKDAAFIIGAFVVVSALWFAFVGALLVFGGGAL